MNNLLKEIELFYKYSRLSKETLRKYSYRLNYFSAYLSLLMGSDKKDINLNEVYHETDSTGISIRYLPIDSLLLDEYFQLLIPKGFYPLRDHHSALKSFFLFLERNYSFNNPFEGMEFKLSDYYPDKKYSRVLTRSEIIKFLNSLIKNSKDFETDLILFTVLLSTGCRISEILNLKYNALDTKNDSFILVDTKTRVERIVNLRPGIGSIINNYCLERKRNISDFIFLNNDNKNFSQAQVNSLFNHFLFLADLSPLTLHGLRHTFATLMADENTPITIIQQLLGHKSIKSTKGYINPHYVRNKNFFVEENQLLIEVLSLKL